MSPLSGVYTFKAGDTAPLKFRIDDVNGPVPLDPGVPVELLMGPARADLAGTLPSIVGTCTILDDGSPALRGWAQYEWATGQTDTPGVYHVNARLVLPDGTTKTFPDDGHADLVIERPAA